MSKRKGGNAVTNAKGSQEVCATRAWAQEKGSGCVQDNWISTL